MKYCLHFDPSHCRIWHGLLAERLSANPQVQVFSSRSAPKPHPSHVEKLLSSEAGSLFKEEAHLASPMPVEAFERKAPALSHSEDSDLVIDLVGDGSAPKGKKRVTLLFNGFPSEEVLMTSILASGMPQIAFRDEAGAIVATAEPSGELAKGPARLDGANLCQSHYAFAGMGAKSRALGPAASRAKGRLAFRGPPCQAEG